MMTDAEKLADIVKRLAAEMRNAAVARAERDEAIAALRNLVRHDQADDARNRQPNCIELHEAIAILSKHPQKVTT